MCEAECEKQWSICIFTLIGHNASSWRTKFILIEFSNALKINFWWILESYSHSVLLYKQINIRPTVGVSKVYGHCEHDVQRMIWWKIRAKVFMPYLVTFHKQTTKYKEIVVRRAPQRPRVNDGSPTFMRGTKVANRCLIANTQHISHNQRGPETVVLLQQKHQSSAQRLMWQNSGGRCRIHYISIQRFCEWSRLLIAESFYRQYVSPWKSTDSLSVRHHCSRFTAVFSARFMPGTVSTPGERRSTCALRWKKQSK